MAHDVFISYSSLDKDAADAVCSILEEKGISCWMAPRNITPGMTFAEAIIDGIKFSKVFVLIYSSNTNNSTQVIREVDRAVHNGLSIINFRLDNVPLSKQLEYYISSVHWLDAMTPPLEQHIHQLYHVIQMFLKPAEVKDAEIAEALRKGIIKQEEKADIAKRFRIAKKSTVLVSGILLAFVIAAVSWLIFDIGGNINGGLLTNVSSSLSGKAKNKIAVLPLKIIGDQPNLNFLSSGLVETLTYMLSKIGNSQQIFSVIPASEVVESITAQEARKKFGATLVISGSIQMEGTTGRIILNLINTKKQQLVKSEKLDYIKENNFILQDEAIKLIVDMLGLRQSSIEDSHLTKSGSDSYEANELYLIGKGILREGIERVEDIDAAIDLFNLSIKKDTTFALAYSGIADANILKYHFTSVPEYIDDALDYSIKAVNLNDNDPEIISAYAGSLVEKGEFLTADSLYRIAIKMDSLNPRLYADLGYSYSIQSKPDIAEENYLKAVALNPENYVSVYELAAFYYSENRFDDAIREMKNAVELAPSHLTLLYGLGICYFGIGNIDEALETFESINAIDSTQSHILENLGTCYFFNGDYMTALRYYTQAIEYNPDNYVLYGLAGWSYFEMEDETRANSCFSQAISNALRHTEYSFDRSVATYYGLMGMTDSSYYYLNRCDISDEPLDQDPASAFMFGELFIILGEMDKAFDFIGSALKREYGWTEVKYHPLFKTLQNDPEFQALLADSKP